jgi:hypothetical protein
VPLAHGHGDGFASGTAAGYARYCIGHAEANDLSLDEAYIEVLETGLGTLETQDRQ